MAFDDKTVPVKHRITLTRAALYLLEGIMQMHGPATTNPKVVQSTKAWDKIRSANNRMIKTSWAPEGHDFEKMIMRNEGESDFDFTKRDIEWKDAVKRWEDSVVTIAINDRTRDICREFVEWVQAHRDDQKVGIKLSGKHAASLLLGFGIVKPSEAPDDDYEVEVVEDAEPQHLAVAAAK